METLCVASGGTSGEFDFLVSTTFAAGSTLRIQPAITICRVRNSAPVHDRNQFSHCDYPAIVGVVMNGDQVVVDVTGRLVGRQSVTRRSDLFDARVAVGSSLFFDVELLHH